MNGLKVTLPEDGPLTRLLLAPLTDAAVRDQQRTAAYVIATVITKAWDMTPPEKWVERFRVADVASDERMIHGIRIEAAADERSLISPRGSQDR